MKSFFTAVWFVLAVGANSQVESGVNLRQLFSNFLDFLANSQDSVNICESGYKLEVSGDSWKCVQKENDEKEPPNCPAAIVCPSNPSCAIGFQLLVHENNCCCVQKDVAESSEEAVIIPECPAACVCPSNPTCSNGFQVLISQENCCCVKEDVFIDVNDKDGDGLVDPKICPICSSTLAGEAECDCIWPMIKSDSAVDSSLKCCLDN